jgi:hypothetical protein
MYLEVLLNRIINTESVGKERTRLTKAIVLAVRELALESEPGDNCRDLAAFISLGLDAITGTIDISVAAWEKRDYWVKADRFRMEWAWTTSLASQMREAALKEDWGSVAQIAAKVVQRLSAISVSSRHRMGRPWTGAWNKLIHDNKQKVQKDIG